MSYLFSYDNDILYFVLWRILQVPEGAVIRGVGDEAAVAGPDRAEARLTRVIGGA